MENAPGKVPVISRLLTRRDDKAIIHRRHDGAGTPYTPKIRVEGPMNVRELLGRDDDEPIRDPDAE